MAHRQHWTLHPNFRRWSFAPDALPPASLREVEPLREVGPGQDPAWHWPLPPHRPEGTSRSVVHHD